MSDFKAAVAEWVKKKDEYVNASVDARKNTVSPRTELLMTIPTNCVEEFKAIAKRMRKEEDEKFKSNIEQRKLSLALEFERSNPIPHIKDYNFVA